MKNALPLQYAQSYFGRILLLQMIVTFILSTIISFVNLAAGYSVLLGGLICVIGNGVFIKKGLVQTGALAARQILFDIYRGEFLKILAISGLFILVFKYLKIVPWAFFVGYIVTQLAFWSFPLVFRR